jgi:hypothetical protein
LRAVTLVALLSATAAVWLARAYLSGAELEPDTGDAFALSIIGGWWNIAGDRHLALDWEGRRASLRDYSKSDAGVESTGSWRTTKTSVIVHVAGAAGELDQELELIGNDAEMFLAPTPAGQARLLDSWIADHDQDDEDMSPSDSTARETRASALASATKLT